MLKTLGFLPRRGDFSRPDFRDYYERQHTPLALRHIRVFAKYVRNHLAGTQSAQVPFDTISEFWYDDADAISVVAGMLGSPAGSVLREDEAKFMDRRTIAAFGVREQLLLGPPREFEPGPLRKFALLLMGHADAGDAAHAAALQDYCAGIVQRHAASLARASLDVPVTPTPAHLPVAALLWLWPVDVDVEFTLVPPDGALASIAMLSLEAIETPRALLRD